MDMRMDIQHEHENGQAALTCGRDMQHGHATWTAGTSSMNMRTACSCGMSTPYVHAACPCSTSMLHVLAACQCRMNTAAKTVYSSLDVQHGHAQRHAVRTCNMDFSKEMQQEMQYRHAAWTNSMDNAAWTYSMDILLFHAVYPFCMSMLF
jgi:hypothetical protein